MSTFQQMKSTRDRGLTVIELLVVLVILGMLAAITIPVYLNQRKKGFDATIKSDLRNVAHAQQGFLTTVPPADIRTGTSNAADLLQQGATYSPGNVIEVFITPIGYCLRGSNPSATAKGGSDGYWFYDSAFGGLQAARSAALPTGACGAPAPSWVNVTDTNPTTPTPTPTPTTPVPTTPVPTTPVPTTPVPTTPVPTTPAIPMTNDECDTSKTLAHPATDGATTVFADGTNIGATGDTFGPSNAWWLLAAPRSDTYTLSLSNHAVGPVLTGQRTITVYEGKQGIGNGDCKKISDLTLVTESTGTRPVLLFTSTGNNSNYFITVSSTVPNQANFKINVLRTP